MSLFVCGIMETRDGFRGSETSIRSRKCLSKSHGWLFDKQNKTKPHRGEFCEAKLGGKRQSLHIFSRSRLGNVNKQSNCYLAAASFIDLLTSCEGFPIHLRQLIESRRLFLLVVNLLLVNGISKPWYESC